MYVTVDGEHLWSIFTDARAPNGLYRGGGNTKSAKMTRMEGGKETVREADFTIQWDKGTNEYVVYPNPTKGLSFSNSIERLKDIPVEGKVWLFPRNKDLPKGLVMNYKTFDHPLLNVKEKMSLPTLIEKLKEMEALMHNTGVKI